MSEHFPKPGDDPNYFQFPAPPGRSRESTIVLDEEGHFLHDDVRFDHAKLEAALHTWISRHPDDGRYILTNGYDWTYFTVRGTPYFVTAIRVEGDRVTLTLSDTTEEPWNVLSTRTNERGALVTKVKPDAKGGPYEATFSRHAQVSLAPLLETTGSGLAVKIGENLIPIARE